VGFLATKSVKKHHPDVGGSNDDMKYINAAYDVLKDSTPGSSKNGYDDYFDNLYRQREEPADYDERQRQRKDRYNTWRHDKQQSGYSDWAQAGYSGGWKNSDYISREDFHCLNFCKRTAWEISGKPPYDADHTYTVWAWDGMYFRGSFSVFAIPEKMFEISKMMEIWDDLGTVAVFYTHLSYPNKVFLVNLRGKEVNPPKEFEHESFNQNPGNDAKFKDFLSKNL
jgi:curved DNA-binding protein CbpA